MKKSIVFISMILILLFNCGHFQNNYKGKIFDIRVETWDSNGAKKELWSNVCDLSYNKEENKYSFYIDGKYVEIDNASSVIITESGAIKPTYINDIFYNKFFNVSCYFNNKFFKWNNVSVKILDLHFISFIFENKTVVIPNDNVIIEEVIR